MILQELSNYYFRKLKTGEMSPPGLEQKEIPYIIEIDERGAFKRIISAWLDSKKKRARSFLVPKAEKRTRAAVANLLWDNPEFVFGIRAPGKTSSEEALTEKRALFRERVRAISGQHPDLKSVLLFLESLDLPSLQKDPLAVDLIGDGRNITFKLEDREGILLEDPEILSICTVNQAPAAETIFCPVIGRPGPLARLHPAIKGVRGAQSTGGNIVSFNENAYESFGKEQGANATISEAGAFAYTTALNQLLGKDSAQKLYIGGVTITFWAAEACELEALFGDLFEYRGEDTRQREKIDASRIKAHYQSALRGRLHSISDLKTRFFVLGISPNASRLSIRFWYPSTVHEISSNLESHFGDLELIHGPTESGYISVREILTATAVQGKDENVNPLLAGKVIQSIVSGSVYPEMLLGSLITRMHAEHSSTPHADFVRCSMIKAILNRKVRKGILRDQEVKMSVDETNHNPGYLLGRFFAVMEMLQERAIRSANATIRDRYYGSASTRPASVFPVLVNLSMHHSSKVGGGLAVVYEKKKQEILKDLRVLPRVLTLDQQGYFALGYYQERQQTFAEIKEKSGENQ